MLNPLQASWFVFECYPQHCDSLALLNAVFEAFADEAPRPSETVGKQDDVTSLNMTQYTPDAAGEPMFP